MLRMELSATAQWSNNSAFAASILCTKGCHEHKAENFFCEHDRHDIQTSNKFYNIFAEVQALIVCVALAS